MTGYELSWITDHVALGHAPMSYAELDSIRGQGISAIVNLCAEFEDLHHIQEKHGFEVYYLPTPDNEAPALAELEKALDWLDESVYLGKKVLVHCRLGIGRTGTFATAFLLRKGFALKVAAKKIEKTRAVSSSFAQWRLLRKYRKTSGQLTVREPSLESERTVDLSPFFLDYEALLAQIDRALQEAANAGAAVPSCGWDTEECCYRPVDLHLIEAAYLSNGLNRTLKSHERRAAIERAAGVAKKIRAIETQMKAGRDRSGGFPGEVRERYLRERIKCPLNVDAKCIVYPSRPVACRIYGLSDALFGAALSERLDLQHIRNALTRTSKALLHALTSTLPSEQDFSFTLSDTVSGKFVQQYFERLVQGL